MKKEDEVKDTKILEYNDIVKISKYVNPVKFGNIKKVRQLDNKKYEVKPLNSIDEFTFYYLYCTINNIIEKQQIAKTQLLVMSAIMAKPLTFSLPIDSKDGKLTRIAEELSTKEKQRTPNSIYQSVKRLRDRKYLVETEDRLIVPNAKFQFVRQAVKGQLKKQGFASFDYLFQCFISNKSNKGMKEETLNKNGNKRKNSIPENLKE